MEDINRLQGQLNIVKDSLPDNLQVSDVSLRYYCGHPEWPAFIMLHTWIFQLHLDLYRFALPGIREQAHSELFRALPQGFLINAQYQAIAFAIVLSRFWESSLSLMRSLSPSQEQLLTADHVLPPCIIQSTKILLLARQYSMFFDLRACSTVPAFRDEPADDTHLERLVKSNMALLDSLVDVMPKVKIMVSKIKSSHSWLLRHR